MLFTFVSQLPLIQVKKPNDLIKHNQVTLMLGLAIYITLGYLIYSGRMPTSVMVYLPPTKWLWGLILLDIVLYCIIHRFQFGLFPVLSLQQLPGMVPLMIEDNTNSNNGRHGGSKGHKGHKASKRHKKRTDSDSSESSESTYTENSSNIDLTAEEVDELSSILKNHQTNDDYGHEQYGGGINLHTAMQSPMIPPGVLPPQPPLDQIPEPPLMNQSYHNSNFIGPIMEQDSDPVEVSVADGDYFQKNNKTVVENWDVDDDEFSNMEYVESHSKKGHNSKQKGKKNKY